MSDTLINFSDTKFWAAKCPKCGWKGMSDKTAGGSQIADTGDYNDCVCPVCIAPGGNYENGHWVPVEKLTESDHIQNLERELAAANRKIQRLVEAGNENQTKMEKAIHTAKSMWGKAVKKPGIIASDGDDILYRMQGVLYDVNKSWTAAKEEKAS